MKSKTTAALLALFLGGFGVHWFYLKKTGLGILYIFLFYISSVSSYFLFGIPYILMVILCFVHFIIFLTMSNEEFNEKYNKGDTSRLDGLKKLHELLEMGAITQEEFESKKQNFL